MISGVVNIEFAANLISRRRKHSRKAVPEGAAPCVSDVHGACGICRNKFHVDHFPATEIGAAVAFTLFVYIKENVGVKFIGKAEIDKSRAGYFRTFCIAFRKVEIIENYLRDFCGSHAEGSRRNHGGVDGIVAVCAVGGNFNTEIGNFAFGKLPLFHGRFKGRNNGLLYLVFRFTDNFRHKKVPFLGS